MNQFTGRVFADGELTVATVTFDSKIRSIEKIAAAAGGDRILIPGAVDAHVHINEPGRTEWEGFETATKAACAGGTTTLIDMPLNCIPATIDVEALQIKREAARGKTYCHVGFWGGAVPGNCEKLRALRDAGVLGFKCFMVPSGVDEFDFVAVEDLARSAEMIATIDSLLLAHAEDPAQIEADSSVWEGADPRAYQVYLNSRTEAAERIAVQTLVEQSRRTGCRIHIVHVAAASALEVIAQAKQEGLPISAETCVHYLTFCADDVEDGNTAFKCAPPIRGAHVRDALWHALSNGTLDFVTTDHSPSPPVLKSIDTGRFDTAWGGISSVQFFLSVMFTEASNRRIPLTDVIRWCASAPAEFAGLKSKGAIEVGRDADLVIFDPTSEFVVSEDQIFHRHKLTPYLGRTLRGVAQTTYVSGEIAWADGHHTLPNGSLV